MSGLEPALCLWRETRGGAWEGSREGTWDAAMKRGLETELSVFPPLSTDKVELGLLPSSSLTLRS